MIENDLIYHKPFSLQIYSIHIQGGAAYTIKTGYVSTISFHFEKAFAESILAWL